MFTIVADEMHENPMGTMHGGIIATLVDSAMGCAVFSMLPAGTAYTTLELKTNYVRPIVQTTGVVRAEGRVVHPGGRVATTEATVHDEHGTLYAARDVDLPDQTATGRCVMNYLGVDDRRPTARSSRCVRSGRPTSTGSSACSTASRPRRCIAASSRRSRSRRAAMLMWLTNVDHDRREALVAVHGNEIVAVARYDGQPGSADAEIAVTVEDAWQHQGIGHRLARRLAACALDHGFERFIGTDASRQPRGDRPPAPALDGRERSVQRWHLLGGGAAVARELTRFSAAFAAAPGADRRTVVEPVHEPQPGPRVVDRAHLVVDETVRQADIAHDVLA